MIKVVSNPHNIEITLTPNRSLSTAQTQWVVFAVCTIIFIIALFWSIQGAFMVLPFAGLDIVLFAFIMFKINQDGLYKQLITIDSRQVLIQSGKSDIEEERSFMRTDTYLVVAEQKNKKSLSIKISDSKNTCEIGSFLTMSDKLEARKAFEASGIRELSEKWWVS